LHFSRVTHGDHEDFKVSDTARYQSDTAVNHSEAQASGHSDLQNLRVGGFTNAENYGAAPGAIATSRATVTAKFKVTGGSSGLVDGTAVDLNWLCHLEGSTSIIRPYGSGEGDDVVAAVAFGLDLTLTNEIYSGHQSWSADCRAERGSHQAGQRGQQHRNVRARRMCRSRRWWANGSK